MVSTKLVQFSYSLFGFSEVIYPFLTDIIVVFTFLFL